MIASDYNRKQVNKGAWSIDDLPGAWPGKQSAIDQGVNSAQFCRAVQCFQAGAGLDPDGKVGPVTLAALRLAFQGKDEGRTDPDNRDVLTAVGDVTFRRATRADARPDRPIQGKDLRGRRIADLWNQYGAAIADQADEYNIPIRVALAVFATEAGSGAYDPKTGLVIIRFETHIFTRMTGEIGTDRNHDGRQSTEWSMLKDAAGIDPDKAFASTSFGLAQIMGFNHRSVGYSNPAAMAAAFQGDVINQVKAFFAFCKSGGLDDYIQRQDWITFTRRYNGPGQVAYYSSVLQQHLAAARELSFS